MVLFILSARAPGGNRASFLPGTEKRGSAAQSESKELIQAQARGGSPRRPAQGLLSVKCLILVSSHHLLFHSVPWPASMAGLVRVEHKAAFAQGAKRREAAAEAGASPHTDWPHSSPARRGLPRQGTHGSELPSGSLVASGERK